MMEDINLWSLFYDQKIIIMGRQGAGVKIF